MKNFDLSLYLVTDRSLSQGRSTIEVVKEAVKGGITMVQLREKEADSYTFYQEALALKHFLTPLNIPLIINDRLDIALAVDADGLHIGQHDLPYTIARKWLGPDKIIGLSIETEEEARQANALDVDYIGLSPVFTTATKQDINTPLALEGVRKIAHFSQHPMVGIGGINATNATEVIMAGADGVAVISAIVAQKEIALAASQLKKIIHHAQS
jgi:thiamine-phosphate pyrophosphorylase